MTQFLPCSCGLLDVLLMLREQSVITLITFVHASHHAGPSSNHAEMV